LKRKLARESWPSEGRQRTPGKRDVVFRAREETGRALSATDRFFER